MTPSACPGAPKIPDGMQRTMRVLAMCRIGHHLIQTPRGLVLMMVPVKEDKG